ncbi:MAG: OmpA family protein [Candidatus Binatia bacterium]
MKILNRLGAVIFLLGSVAACSSPDNQSAVGSNNLMPVSMQGLGQDKANVHSLSAMEAMSRGLAAVTPPGAALKDIYYEFDSTGLAAEAQEILKQNAQWMKANPAARVEIEGHCDDVGSDDYNLALGAKRAQTAKDFLVSQNISSDRLVTISYGKEAPACFEPNEDCRVKNRRARFVMFTELPTS